MIFLSQDFASSVNSHFLRLEGKLYLAAADVATYINFHKTILSLVPLPHINLFTMNAYQQKWLQVLKRANLPGWEIEAQGDDINVKMPHVTDLKLIKDNLPQAIASLSLDIDLPKERLKFLIENGYEHFEYILNPNQQELNNE